MWEHWFWVIAFIEVRFGPALVTTVPPLAAEFVGDGAVADDVKGVKPAGDGGEGEEQAGGERPVDAAHERLRVRGRARVRVCGARHDTPGGSLQVPPSRHSAPAPDHQALVDPKPEGGAMKINIMSVMVDDQPKAIFRFERLRQPFPCNNLLGNIQIVPSGRSIRKSKSSCVVLLFAWIVRISKGNHCPSIAAKCLRAFSVAGSMPSDLMPQMAERRRVIAEINVGSAGAAAQVIARCRNRKARQHRPRRAVIMKACPLCNVRSHSGPGECLSGILIEERPDPFVETVPT